MPEIDLIIKPIHPYETIAWWEKDVDSKPVIEPDSGGKFIRLIWNEESKTHSAACNKKYDKGIITFIYGRTPEFGDNIKIVDRGKNTCRGIVVSRYEDEIDTIMKELEHKGDDSIEDIVFDAAGRIIDTEENIDDKDSMILHGVLCIGVARRMQYGKSYYNKPIKEDEANFKDTDTEDE